MCIPRSINTKGSGTVEPTDKRWQKSLILEQFVEPTDKRRQKR